MTTTTAAGLAAELRRATARQHADLEAATGLPASIRTHADYVRALRWMLRAHAACEAALDGCDGWDALGVDAAERRKVPLIAADLRALGAAPAPRAPLTLELPGVGHQIGAIYVVEGATLGGARMAPVVEERIGPPAREATRFLRAYGARRGAMWREITHALIRWGDHAGAAGREDAAAGARAAFDVFRTAADDG